MHKFAAKENVLETWILLTLKTAMTLLNFLFKVYICSVGVVVVW